MHLNASPSEIGLEARLGRHRTSDPNAPRTIDIDVAIWGDETISDPQAGLRVPDPDIGRMAHLAFPLRDLAPEFVHPALGASLGELADALRDEPGIQVRLDVDLSEELIRWRELRW